MTYCPRCAELGAEVDVLKAALADYEGEEPIFERSEATDDVWPRITGTCTADTGYGPHNEPRPCGLCGDDVGWVGARLKAAYRNLDNVVAERDALKTMAAQLGLLISERPGERTPVEQAVLHRLHQLCNIPLQDGWESDYPLVAERDALKAHVERLRDTLKWRNRQAKDILAGMPVRDVDECESSVERALSNTPEQSLADHDRRVWNEAIEAAASLLESDPTSCLPVAVGAGSTIPGRLGAARAIRALMRDEVVE